MQAVGRASARAVELSPAVRAFRLRVYVAVSELLLQFFVSYTFPDVAQLVSGVGHELVAGIQVAPRGDCHVLSAGTAAGYPLEYAGTAGKVYHVVVERKGPALALSFKHKLRKLFVLFLYDLHIAVRERAGIVRSADNWLHGELRKAEPKHFFYVLKEVRILMGKGAAHVVALVSALFHKSLKSRHYSLPAAVSRVVHSVAVVDFLAAVQTKDHVVHLFVRELRYLVVQKHTVCGKGEAEVLAGFFFYAAGVRHKLLADVPVQQRLASEEVHLQIVSGAGILHKKVQRPLAYLKAHESPFALKVALAGKTVRAVEVATVRNMQAQRFYYAFAALLKASCQRGVAPVGEQLA